MTADHITQPYTLDELRAKIASNDYSAELLLQHAMLLLDGQSPAKGDATRRGLLPCPFCGRRPVLTVRPDNAEATSYFAAVACFCDGYAACAHKDATASEADEAERLAREKWNCRSAQPQPKHTAEPVAWIRWEWNRSGGKSLEFFKPDELSLSEQARGVVYDPLYAQAPAPAPEQTDCGDCNCLTQCGDAAAWAEEVAQMTGSPEVPEGERWCLWCDKAGHQTHECWSTHGVNTPDARELWRLTKASQCAAVQDELREELAAAEKSVSVYMAERNQARDRVRQLRAELDAVANNGRDAARYRVLRDKQYSFGPRITDPSNVWLTYTPEGLDQACDDMLTFEASSKPPVQGNQP